MLSSEFYRRDFRDMKDAADFLGVSLAELVSVLYDKYGVSLQDFIRSMRIEDVLNHLRRINSRERLRKLAALYGFRSGLHLLWYFIRAENCTPRIWCSRIGCRISEHISCEQKRSEERV